MQFDEYHIYSDGLVKNHQLVEFFMVFVKDDFPSIFLEVDRGCEIKKTFTDRGGVHQIPWRIHGTDIFFLTNLPQKSATNVDS